MCIRNSLPLALAGLWLDVTGRFAESRHQPLDGQGSTGGFHCPEEVDQVHPQAGACDQSHDPLPGTNVEAAQEQGVLAVPMQLLDLPTPAPVEPDGLQVPVLSLIHISEPTRLGMISYAV